MFVAARRRTRIVGWLVAAVSITVVAGLMPGAPAASANPARVVKSTVIGSDGQKYTATNHLSVPLRRGDRHRPGPRREWVLAWAGDEPSEAIGGTATTEDPHAAHRAGRTAKPDPDFLAVIDVTKGSRSYGKVANTVTFEPLTQTEPHHMQYLWHKGQRIFAGAFFTDTTYVLDVSKLPLVRLVGINLSIDTPCGSVPDAYWVLDDGTAYGTYLGGPDVPGPCQYTNGEVRVGNGFAGSPGEIVRFAPNGRTLAEIPAALPDGEDPAVCHSTPQLDPATCANPHGIAVREDLNRMVISDFAEVRNYLDPDNTETNPFLLRDTVRIFDITNRNDPELVSVSHLPEGPRVDQLPAFSEPRMVMETTLTNLPWHRGAFASTMAGGAVYHTPDITDPTPEWREVFDDSTAFREIDPTGVLSGSNGGGSWLQTSLDDRYLFHAVMGSDPRVPRELNSGLVYVLDIRRLLASGNQVSCSIDTVAEVTEGGAEPDCPALVDVLPIRDDVSPRVGVGPHWGALDHFSLGRDGYYHEDRRARRLATTNYFVAQTGIDGDHRLCMVDVARWGGLSLDKSFRDEQTGEPCVDFNRTKWPHGRTGNAKPHGILFAVADANLR